MSENTKRADPDRATWTMEELAMIFSARDQIAFNRRCERSIGSLCGDSSMTNLCECLESAAKRVGADLLEDELP